jgi:N-methylhydantoinase A
MEVSDLYEEMEENARADFSDEGVDPENLIMNRRLDVRFSGQAEEFPLDVEQRQFRPEDAEHIEERFVKNYERRYGSGTAWIESDIEIQNLRIEATAPVATPASSGETGMRADGGSDQGMEIKEHREVFLLGQDEYEEVPIYDGRELTPGFSTDETAIIERPYTTIFVPPKASLEVDQHSHARLHL